ncbi:hypothetical protein ACFC58_06115 [Kitasatospora purpeofusca]|uniref:hypothetical protein n=1 Tax=Kitasatospora purpeofusca TaxID=67352 RepID=UPI0035E192CF
MLQALTVTATARADQKSPRGRVRPARTTTVAILRATKGWESACIMRHGRPTRDALEPVKSLRAEIRAAQHESGAFVPDREWPRSCSGARTTAFVAKGDNGGLKWRLFSVRNGSFLVEGSGPCGWDGMYREQHAVRGGRAAVRAFQHAIKHGEVRSGAFASQAEELY